jgi:protein TonB
MMRISPAMLLITAAATACGKDEPTEDPRPLAQESPFEYPIALWDEGAEGEAMLMVRVTAQGQVDSTYVERSSGYAAFDSAAVEGARKLRFSPGRKGEKRVESWARLPVKFTKSAPAAGQGEAVPEKGT